MILREAWALAQGLDGLEAGVLLAEAVGLDRSDLYLQPERTLQPEEVDLFKGLVAKRLAGWPIAYLIGRREFYGGDFAVDGRVLIPRPETELLVEVALRALPGGPVRVGELGVGSGAVILTLARRRPAWRLYGTDLSPAATLVARRNARRLGLAGRVRLWTGDLGEPLRRHRCRVDLLLMNPPYLRTDELPKSGPGSEPTLALDGGPDGLLFYRRLAAEVPELLNPGGRLLVEVGAGQADAVAAIFQENLGGLVERHLDLAGWERALWWEGAG